MSSPTTGSAQRQPIATPAAPASTASEVNPSVRACRPSGDQRGRADPAARPDPVAGDQLVAREADRGRDRDRGQVGYLMRVRQRADRGIGGGGRRQHDYGHDDDAGQVLGPAVAVGVTAGGKPPAEQERDAERHRGQRVGPVVQRVAEQCDRAGQRHHHRLRQRGRAQPGQRDPQGPQALSRGFKHRVDRPVVIVGMRPDRMPQPGPEPPVTMLVRVVVGGGRARGRAGARVVLVAAHSPSMTRKTSCSTSTSATRVRLRIVRSCGQAGEGGKSAHGQRGKANHDCDGRTDGGCRLGFPRSADRGTTETGLLRVRRRAALLVVPARAGPGWAADRRAGRGTAQARP